MSTTVHLLPRCPLDLRPLHGQHAQREVNWVLRSRDERARPLWEVVLSSADLHDLLESLADGQAYPRAGAVQVKVYPDAELEVGVCRWAAGQIERHCLMFARPGLLSACNDDRSTRRL